MSELTPSHEAVNGTLGHCVSYLGPSIGVGARWSSVRSAPYLSSMKTVLMALATRPTTLQAALEARSGRTASIYQ